MPHYFSQKQEGEFTPHKIHVGVGGLNFELLSAPGIFSKDELDFGSFVLIDNAKIKDGDSVLDLGCGNGVTGISIAKLYKVILTMCDVNERAVKIAKLNAKNHKLHAEVLQSNIYEKLVDKKFDVILLNPPQSAGKDVCFQMIEGSKEHLNLGGSLQIVARKKKGGETLSKKMEETFGNVQVLGKKGGFFVYISIN